MICHSLNIVSLSISQNYDRNFLRLLKSNFELELLRGNSEKHECRYVIITNNVDLFENEMFEIDASDQYSRDTARFYRNLNLQSGYFLNRRYPK